MRIRTLITVGTVIWVAFGTAVGGSLYITFRDVDEALRKNEVARDIAQGVFELTVLTGDYLLYYEERAQTQWKRKHESLGRLLAEPGFRGVEEEPLITVLRAHHVEIGRIFGEVVANRQTVQAQEGPTDFLLELQQRLMAQLLIKSQTMETGAIGLGSKSIAEVRDAERQAGWLVIVLGASVVIVMAGTWIVVATRVVRPIGKLQRGIQILGGGDLDYRIGPLGKDEIGEVARSFDEMAEQLSTTTVSRNELAKEVTERERAEEALRGANAELEAFSYSVSHDLRAPLRAMDGFSQVLLEDYADNLDAEGRDHLGRVRGASQHMAQLIEDLLELSRVTRAELRHGKSNLSELAQAISAEFRKAEPDRQVTFDIAPGVIAEGDERLLRIVLENLLGNAWKFTSKHPQGKIEFGATTHDGKPAYYVRDDGAGFDMAYADKLFKPFQRLHKTGEFPGTGIGLATAARIIQRHGGRIWAESAVEQGTTVYFSLGTKLVTKGEAV